MEYLSPQFDVHWFHEFSLDVLSLVVTTSAFVKKKRSKMHETSKKNRESNGGQWDILLLNLTCIGFMDFLDVSSLIFSFLQMLML